MPYTCTLYLYVYYVSYRATFSNICTSSTSDIGATYIARFTLSTRICTFTVTIRIADRE